MTAATKKRRPVTGPDRDRQVYDLARAYVLSFRLDGVTEEILDHYINPRLETLTPKTMGDVFHRLLKSARNRQMMANVVPDSVVEGLGPIFDGFRPNVALERFPSPEILLRTIIKELKPAGKRRRTARSLLPQFAQAALSGARFLAQFKDAADFCAWVRRFDKDPRMRAALPTLISEEVQGFGFALACDFLKELGFVNFAKPDVHIKAIVAELGLSDSRADYVVFKAVDRIAKNCGTNAYNVDKLFWLTGSGRFYDHRETIGHQGRLPVDREEFIRHARKALGDPT